jgi:hypothetical protein
MRAKPKKYVAAGWTGDFAFRLSERDRARLRKAPFNLRDDDFAWIEQQATRYRIAEAEEKPTPGEIHAALDEGATRVSSMLEWLRDLDDDSRDVLESSFGSYEHWQAIEGELKQRLNLVFVALGAARQSAPEPKAGRLNSNHKNAFTMRLVERFSARIAVEIDVIVTGDAEDTIKRRVPSGD